MLNAVKFRIYPNAQQKELISKHFGCSRVVYNYFLDYRQKQYAKGIKETYFTMQKVLTQIKRQEKYHYLNECNSQSLQMALRQLVSAYDNFFSKRARYPKFKSKKNAKQSFAIPQNIEIKTETQTIALPKFKEGIKAKLHRDLPKDSVIKQAFISCIADQYFCSLSYEAKEPIPKPTLIKKAVGLDMGLRALIVTSDKIEYPHIRFYQKLEKKLTKAQRRLSKKIKGSNNRKKQAKKVARLHLACKNIREDYLHKISDEITNQYDLIGVETLNVKGLMRTYHSKSLANASWGKFLAMLEYKAQRKGKTLLSIDRFFPSSQLCSYCGFNTGKKHERITKFTCPHCQTTHHRDYNASVNIRNYALGMLDERHKIKIDKSRVGIIRTDYAHHTNERIKACGASSNGVISKYGNILDLASYGAMKQEKAQSL
ncbi:transposase [Helicobacter pylori]|nr:transposase [Helicobacter pylori]